MKEEKKKLFVDCIFRKYVFHLYSGGKRISNQAQIGSAHAKSSLHVTFSLFWIVCTPRSDPAFP